MEHFQEATFYLDLALSSGPKSPHFISISKEGLRKLGLYEDAARKSDSLRSLCHNLLSCDKQLKAKADACPMQEEHFLTKDLYCNKGKQNTGEGVTNLRDSMYSSYQNVYLAAQTPTRP